MTYTRSGTVDMTRFANNVLDNVVVRDCFRHDVELLSKLQSRVPTQVEPSLRYILQAMIGPRLRKTVKHDHHFQCLEINRLRG